MKNEGILFYLSGEQGSVPEIAAGNPEPNFFKDVEVIGDGRKGKALRCLPTQLLAYWAPGNLYSQRGTVSFFWRSRTPLGPTEFPLFRVSFADHSSWDALFMRIDYNGHGIDAFVTDINLSRLRVSHRFEALPEPDQWFHVAFSWDETVGVRLYIDGELAAKLDREALLYAGLDQFGTHSRVISNAQVQSSYNYMRTGDFDEITVFDRMLTDGEVRAVSRLEMPALAELPARDLREERWNREWQRRFGFDAGEMPAALTHPATAVRKVEIHDAWDHKRWWWKGCDGIRETTWPGVYNRSGLPGRTDYFVLPDWDCYSVSGKEITFQPVKDAYFNHIEISGSAAGRLRIHGRMEEQLKVRRESCERSVLRLAEPVRNVDITFTNDVIEEPIGDITLLQVEPGVAPEGAAREMFRFAPDDGKMGPECFDGVRAFVAGRFAADERRCFAGDLASGPAEVPANGSAEAPANGPAEVPANGPVGVPASGPAEVPASGPAGYVLPASPLRPPSRALPIAHYMLPYHQPAGAGMDGLLLHLPPLNCAPDHGRYVLVNVQVKDPLWIYRNLINFTFAVLPGAAKEIWLDTRDRILPEGNALYVQIAWSTRISSEYMENISMEVIYKPCEEAKKEHIEDRWIQVKDNYANLVEENPSNEHFNLFNRFKADLTDLLRVCPDHRLAREYWYDKFKTNPPESAFSRCPGGIPLWAWRQTEYMGYVKRYIRWWIDKRQIENGEFGGGLSDDGDLTAWWPGPALAGCMPEKIGDSLAREMEAFYDQGMFANGLCAIQTDQLHTLEEGIQCLGQCLTLFPGSPKYMERAMENARGLHYVTGYNEKGHRHVLSGYYSGTRIAREAPWDYSASDSFHVFHPTYMLVRYNGSPEARRLVMEMADSMLEHYYDGRLHVLVNVTTDEDQVHERTREWPLFYAAWKFTGDEKYLKPIDPALYEQQQDRFPGTDIGEAAAKRYEDILRKAALREYINTDGQLWVDRGVIDIAVMQQDRIGGVGHERFSLYPRHYFRWQFKPSQEMDVAVMVTYAAPDKIRLSAFNMTDDDITAHMIMEDIIPGKWTVKAGTGPEIGVMEQSEEREMELEWMGGLPVVFKPGRHTVLELDLREREKGYWERPDLAMDREDVIIRDDCIRVRVHNIGAAESAETELVLKSPSGEILRRSQVPPIPAPNDLYPKVMEIPLWTRGIDLAGCSVELDPENRMKEITKTNNRIVLQGGAL